MTNLNNPVNLPLDSNGYVKASIWGQNMNPNVNSVLNGVGYVDGLLSKSSQSGLSATVSTANVDEVIICADVPAVALVLPLKDLFVSA